MGRRRFGLLGSPEVATTAAPDKAQPQAPKQGFVRFVMVLVVGAFALLVTAWLLPGFEVAGWRALALAVGVLAALNGLVWPVIARYASGLILFTLGLAALVLNGTFLLAAAEVVPGFEVSSLWVATVASICMTAVTAVLGNVLSLDDDAVWRRQVVHRMVQRVESPEATDVPGVLFLQIDGLSEPVLRRAISEGYMPVLAEWLRSGSHRIVGWECDLSSQTGASQAGILHGDNTDMPAFRWYDKASKRVLTSNRPQDAAEMEADRSTGHGLLAEGGVSRSNVFSGDSPDSLFTFSTVTDKSRSQTRGFNFFMAHPYAISRLIVMGIADVGRELAASRRARRRNIVPRLDRGGIYPLLRAATTVMLQDLTVYTLMADIYRGVPSAYVDFVGYDEVAHHSGIAAPDALETLYRLDQQLARLRRAIDEAPRPYHVVVLSDHGQTQGSTFLQRYDLTLAELVESLIDRSETVDAPTMSPEGWGNLNGILTDTIQDESSNLSKLVKVLVRKHTVDGNVVLGPGEDGHDQVDPADDTGPVVLASGNLGLVSFPGIAGRATLEEIAGRYPGLVAGLAEHPGIGFVMVKSSTLGSMAIGARGICYLEDGRIEGEDPLEPFGPRAIEHIRRTDSFGNAPDLLINSFFDPETDEGAAFEELIGFHGGLGGKQAEPFVMFPTAFPAPTEPLVGAAAIHHLLGGWLHDAAAMRYERPWTVQRLAEADARLGTRVRLADESFGSSLELDR